MLNKTSKLPAETLTPGEWQKRLMYAVLGSFSLSEDIPEEIPSDRVYTAFSQLKSKYPNWLGSLSFQTSKYSTVSKDLEDALFFLGAFGLVTRKNRDFRCLGFSQEDKAAAKARMQKYIAVDNSLEELEELSSEFAKLISQ